MKFTTRAEAGAAYQAAARAYFEAAVELAAHDRADNAIRSLAAQPVIAPHAEFLPHPPGEFGDPITLYRARGDEIAAARAGDFKAASA